MRTMHHDWIEDVKEELARYFYETHARLRAERGRSRGDRWVDLTEVEHDLIVDAMRDVLVQVVSGPLRHPAVDSDLAESPGSGPVHVHIHNTVAGEHLEEIAARMTDKFWDRLRGDES